MGIIIRTEFLPILSSTRKISDRIIIADFKGNPKSSVISCYSPHSGYDEEQIENFYTEMLNLLPNTFLDICGDLTTLASPEISHITILATKMVIICKTSLLNSTWLLQTLPSKNANTYFGRGDHQTATWAKSISFYAEKSEGTPFTTLKLTHHQILLALTTESLLLNANLASSPQRQPVVKNWIGKFCLILRLQNQWTNSICKLGKLYQ